eukprot:1158554-Pelagomonas_calceolata.AAC.5
MAAFCQGKGGPAMVATLSDQSFSGTVLQDCKYIIGLLALSPVHWLMWTCKPIRGAKSHIACASPTQMLPYKSATAHSLVVTIMQMDAEFEDEQIGALFILKGTLDGGETLGEGGPVPNSHALSRRKNITPSKMLCRTYIYMRAQVCVIVELTDSIAGVQVVARAPFPPPAAHLEAAPPTAALTVTHCQAEDHQQTCITNSQGSVNNSTMHLLFGCKPFFGGG